MMTVTIVRFINLFLMGLGTGVSLSHALQAPTKAKLPRDVFLPTQQTLYNNYGLAGAMIEPGSFLSTLGLLFLVRKRRTEALLTLIGLGCIATMFAVWARLINPINQQVMEWTPETTPDNWAEVRDRWHRLHAIRLALHAIGTSAL